MTGPGLEMWNERYSSEEYAYGTDPNDFLKEKLSELRPGKILFGAEGEGRNAVYAAKMGWDVSAFDISIEGKKKAEKLAVLNGVSIDYKVGRLPELGFEKESFDALALIYAHFPPTLRSDYHRLLNEYLKKGSILILEAFSKDHLEYKKRNEQVGGPSNLQALISPEDVKTDFEGYEFLSLQQAEIELNEGLYHNGVGSVTRCIARKE